MPALAIAEALVAAHSGIEPYFVGAERGLEAQVLPARPWRHTLLPLEPIYRRQWWKNARLPWTTLRALGGIRDILRREEPVLAVGTGGYVSGPALWAAGHRGIPIALQEQNAYPGFVTRRLAPRAAQIHLGFPEAESFLRPGTDTEVLDTGNPIVPPPDNADSRWLMADGKKQLGFAPDRPLVLVTCGSQGSLAINQALASALTSGAWPEQAQLLWQTGASTHDQFKHLSAISHQPSAISVVPFLDPIAPAYAAADLVVGRAGAITSAEIAAWGLPSVLIPLPTSAANHQLKNARALADAGAAVLLEQHDLTGASLSRTVGDLLGDPARLAQVASAASRRARPRAAAEIAQNLLRLLPKP